MSDLSFDQRLKLLKEIADAKARFQSIARPWQAEWDALMVSGGDLVASTPSELPALSALIRHLEDELLMIDPTADIPVEPWYREAMMERQQRRIQIQASYRALGEQISAQQPRRVGLSDDGRTYNTSDGQQVSLTTRGAEVLAVLVDRWKSGVTDVPIAFVETEIGCRENTGSTRLRDRVGKNIYKRLITAGDKKGTVRLIHPPGESQ